MAVLGSTCEYTGPRKPNIPDQLGAPAETALTGFISRPIASMLPLGSSGPRTLTA
jgi:hypothetical protein